MTLEKVSLKYEIPVEKLTNAINIPADESRIIFGILKRRHGLEMEGIKEKILVLI